MKRSTWIWTAVGVAAIAVVAVAAMNSKDSRFSPVRIFSPRPVVVPQGTAMSVRLESTVSTKTSSAGDRFHAVVVSPVHVQGKLAIPEGAAVSGHVVVAEQPGKASGRGRLQLEYDMLTFGGHSYDLDSRSRVYLSKSGTKKDVALIGGGAVAGGILGGVLGGSPAKGAVVGGAAGTAASLMTRGPQLTLGRGTILHVRLDRDLSVRRLAA